MIEEYYTCWWDTYSPPTHWAIVGFEYADAKRIMQNIVQDSGKQADYWCLDERDMFTVFEDGTVLRWMPVNTSRSAYRFGKMWCDRNISHKAFRRMLAYFFGDKRDIIWI